MKNRKFNAKNYSKKALRYFYIGLILIALYLFIEPRIGPHDFYGSGEKIRTLQEPFVCNIKDYKTYCGYDEYMSQFFLEFLGMVIFRYIPVYVFFSVMVGFILRYTKNKA